MKQAAVIVARGFEEGEALTIADILRRAEVSCDLVGLDSRQVEGAHGIVIDCDEVLSEQSDYEMLILPGGYGGTDEMCASSLLKDLLKKMNSENRRISAICAAPCVLDQAGVLEGKKFTCYPTVKDRIHSGTYCEDKIVTDGNLITGKGPAAAWAFAYKIVDAFGMDSLAVKKRMVYFNAFDVREDE